jgi:cold shock CspA family protein
MSKSRQSSNKKERESRKRNKKKAKEQRAEVRKANSMKGKGFDSMIAYVDEYGQLSDTPPDPTRRKEISVDQIQIGATKRPEEDASTRFGGQGIVTFYNDEKGFGFITDSQSKERLFFHASNVLTPVKQDDQVSFTKQMGDKGMVAVGVSKID